MGWHISNRKLSSLFLGVPPSGVKKTNWIWLIVFLVCLVVLVAFIIFVICLHKRCKADETKRAREKKVLVTGESFVVYLSTFRRDPDVDFERINKRKLVKFGRKTMDCKIRACGLWCNSK